MALITSGKYIILDSGTVMNFSLSNSITITEESVEDFPSFCVEFRFESNPGGNSELKREIDEQGYRLILRCINFIDRAGSGTLVPIKIAGTEDKELFLNFWIYQLGAEERRTLKLEYTFYLGDVSEKDNAAG